MLKATNAIPHIFLTCIHLEMIVKISKYDIVWEHENLSAYQQFSFFFTLYNILIEYLYKNLISF